jgi:hypothetical protein
MASLQNKSGKFVAPDASSGQLALAGTTTPLLKDLAASAVDPAAPDAYPIVTYSWIAINRRYADAAKGAAIPEFYRLGAVARAKRPRRFRLCSTRNRCCCIRKAGAGRGRSLAEIHADLRNRRARPGRPRSSTAIDATYARSKHRCGTCKPSSRAHHEVVVLIGHSVDSSRARVPLTEATKRCPAEISSDDLAKLPSERIVPK